MSDSNYAAVIRHQRSTFSRPPLDIVDDKWLAHTLSNDDVDCSKQEATIAPLLNDGELDIDTIIVSSGLSGADLVGPAERRRREEGRWVDLGLYQFESDFDNNPIGCHISGNINH